MTDNSASTANLSADPAVVPAVADTAGRNRLVINLLLVATFVVILNETLMAVAIPRLMRDLNVTAGAVQWLTTAFLLTVSVVIPVTGFLAAADEHAADLCLRDVVVHAGYAGCDAGSESSGADSRPHHSGIRDRDHGAAADDHGHDAGTARNSRQDHGLHIHGHLRGAGRSVRRFRVSFSTISVGAGCSCWCCPFRSGR